MSKDKILVSEVNMLIEEDQNTRELIFTFYHIEEDLKEPSSVLFNVKENGKPLLTGSLIDLKMSQVVFLANALQAMVKAAKEITEEQKMIIKTNK